jgi:saccharopine dehydrogenase (NAD+, L-lysine-forming)
MIRENIVQWDMKETARGGPFPEIIGNEIFVNCIYLSTKIPPFVTPTMLDDASRALSVVVDVSCDTTNPNNPIPIYDRNTTFDVPVLTAPTKTQKPLDVVAIDHLPTMLPREASENFCEALLPSLLELKQREQARVWTDSEKLFRQKVDEMSAEQ